MNPFDAIGTARVSQAIADRICRVVLGYQDAAAERSIVRAVTGHDGDVVPFAVAFARATRAHRDVRMGASVRGAIDLVLLIDGLTRLRGEAAMTRLTARDAAYAALSGRIRIADGCDRSPESVLDELLDELWPPDAGRAAASGSRTPATPLRAAGEKLTARRPDAGLPRQVSDSSLRRERRRRTGAPVGQPGRARQQARWLRRGLAARPGPLDADALAGLLAADPDAAAALLADLSQATDPALRAVATAARGPDLHPAGRGRPAACPRTAPHPVRAARRG